MSVPVLRILALALLTATPALAETPVPIERSYRFTEASFAAYDAACVTALSETLAKEFQGLRKVQLDGPAISQVWKVNATTATYAGARFDSDYGAERGTVLCVFPEGQATPSQVEFVFEGRGLAGFKGSPLGATEPDPAKRRSISFATSLGE